MARDNFQYLRIVEERVDSALEECGSEVSEGQLERIAKTVILVPPIDESPPVVEEFLDDYAIGYAVAKNAENQAKVRAEEFLYSKPVLVVRTAGIGVVFGLITGGISLYCSMTGKPIEHPVMTPLASFLFGTSLGIALDVAREIVPIGNTFYKMAGQWEAIRGARRSLQALREETHRLINERVEKRLLTQSPSSQ